jgi:lipid A 3-O-deacylase
MKKALWLGYMLLGMTLAAKSQVITNLDRMVRIYEDNDFMNIRGKGTDEAYTNGTRIDYFYQRKKPPKFLDKWLLPRIGPKAINQYHWSLMQMMITPENLRTRKYLPGDYSYSGALYLSHGLESYNPEKKFSFQSELIMGVMGPLSLAKETQTFIHNMIGYAPPMGWGNQLPNAPLLNYNFTAEKMLWQPGRAFELIGGATAYAGTMLDGAAVHALLRVGLMDPYFGVNNTQGRPYRKFQLYAFVRPTAEYVMYNALLEGGLFSWRNSHFELRKSYKKVKLSPWTTRVDYGIAMAFRRFMISYTQKTQSPSLKGTRQHEVGNISLYIPL